jgi:hypothetical protein
MGALSTSLFAVFGLVALGALQPASAAFPGENGRIAFTSTLSIPNAIYTMNPVLWQGGVADPTRGVPG